MKNWFRKLQNWTSQVAATKWGPLVLFLFAFADASFFPLPVTTLFLILILIDPKKILKNVLYVLLGTLTGAVAGYAIGHYAWLKPNGEFTGVVRFILNWVPGFSQDVYEKIHDLYTKWDFWIITGAAATPLPFGMFTITSGVFGINVFVFLIAIVISQGIKFFLLAYFTEKIGTLLSKIKAFNWRPLAIVTSISIVVAIVVIRVL